MSATLWLGVALLSGCAAVPAPREPSAPASTSTSPTASLPVMPVPALPPVTSVPAFPPGSVKAQPVPIPLPVPGDAEARGLLMRLLPAAVEDRAGWGGDILTAFSSLRLPATAENFCSVIAIIEQESGFRADPEVPGLNRIVWGEIEKRRSKYLIPGPLLDAALRKASPDGRSYKQRIDALRTERQMNLLFEDMIAEFPYGKTLLAGFNPVRTGGPMQVSVAFSEDHARQKGYPYAGAGSIRNEVFIRRGGVFFGVAILLDYPVVYPDAVYRFADFNAGRYSSRNAAFQQAVAKLARKKLDLDGDLLLYEGSQPRAEPSATLEALKPLAGRLGLPRDQIRRDLMLEKSAAFSDTATWRRVFAVADAANKRPMPRAIFPRILLKSPKITRKLTTEWFAKRVDGRYRACLERGKQQG